MKLLFDTSLSWMVSTNSDVWTLSSSSKSVSAVVVVVVAVAVTAVVVVIYMTTKVKSYIQIQKIWIVGQPEPRCVCVVTNNA